MPFDGGKRNVSRDRNRFSAHMSFWLEFLGVLFDCSRFSVRFFEFVTKSPSKLHFVGGCVAANEASMK